MINNDDEIGLPELMGQFQREADALLRDLLIAKRDQPPHLLPEDYVPCMSSLSERWKRAIELAREDVEANRVSFLSPDGLIDYLFSKAEAQIKPWVDELKRDQTIGEMIDRIEGDES
jgi:hypothetical protein